MSSSPLPQPLARSVYEGALFTRTLFFVFQVNFLCFMVIIFLMEPRTAIFVMKRKKKKPSSNILRVPSAITIVVKMNVHEKHNLTKFSFLFFCDNLCDFFLFYFPGKKRGNIFFVPCTCTFTSFECICYKYYFPVLSVWRVCLLFLFSFLLSPLFSPLFFLCFWGLVSCVGQSEVPAITNFIFF